MNKSEASTSADLEKRLRELHDDICPDVGLDCWNQGCPLRGKLTEAVKVERQLTVAWLDALTEDTSTQYTIADIAAVLRNK